MYPLSLLHSEKFFFRIFRLESPDPDPDPDPDDFRNVVAALGMVYLIFSDLILILILILILYRHCRCCTQNSLACLKA